MLTNLAVMVNSASQSDIRKIYKLIYVKNRYKRGFKSLFKTGTRASTVNNNMKPHFINNNIKKNWLAINLSKA